MGSGDRELRGSRSFSGDAGRPERERRDMNLTSSETGTEKWERRGPLPPMESERRSRPSYPRQPSGGFQNRSPVRDSPAETGEWRSSKPLAPIESSNLFP
jgi:hypothetical protein